tara:strand:- start:411 stop:926 length:516 start_codon:yes stop_codon:yes gene_type:complete
MPKGLKPTSQLISIGFGVTESGANTFTQAQIDLQLNVLDREVFVVQAIDLDVLPPDALIGTNSIVEASVSTTSRTAAGSLSNSNTLAVKKLFSRSGNATTPPVGFESGSMETPPTTMEYLGIIATNDFFAQIEGTNNAAVKSAAGKMYGYRAQADADTFAALTQSELLSAN